MIQNPQTALNAMEIATLQGLVNYWKKQNTNQPDLWVKRELDELVRIMGVRLMLVIEDYLKLLNKNR